MSELGVRDEESRRRRVNEERWEGKGKVEEGEKEEVRHMWR